jgi:hypothetical protein
VFSKSLTETTQMRVLSKSVELENGLLELSSVALLTLLKL